jgi:hypothetical protein
MNDEGRLEQVVDPLTDISVDAWIEVGKDKFLSGQVLKKLFEDIQSYLLFGLKPIEDLAIGGPSLLASGSLGKDSLHLVLLLRRENLYELGLVLREL